MMRVIKCVKTDFRLMKNFVWFYLIFFAISNAVIFFSRENVSAFWGLLYMQFAGLVCVTMPFFSQTGFLMNLPARQEERVLGRYLYGLLLMLAVSAAGILSVAIRAFVKKDVALSELMPVAGMMIGIGLVFMAVQFLTMYLLRIRNQQMLSIIRMVPAFVFLFGSDTLADAIMEESAYGFLRWCFAHPNLTVCAVLGIGLLAVLVCAVISCAHERRKY